MATKKQKLTWALIDLQWHIRQLRNGEDRGIKKARNKAINLAYPTSEETTGKTNTEVVEYLLRGKS